MQARLQFQGICGMQVTLGQDLSKYFSFSLSFVVPLMQHTLFSIFCGWYSMPISGHSTQEVSLT
jgi:hypothetical protein